MKLERSIGQRKLHVLIGAHQRDVLMKIKQGAILALFSGFAGGALAAGGGGAALPWNTSITNLAGSLTGGWAVGVATVALAVAFATLAFSNDLSGVGRTLVVLTISISGLLLLTNLLTSLFGGGAQVSESIQVMQFLFIFAALGISLSLATAEMAVYKLWKQYRSTRRQEQWLLKPLAA